MTKYYKALQKTPDGGFCAGWTLPHVEMAIAEITEAMKGPMSNQDRVAAHLDRKALRERRGLLMAAKRPGQA